VSKEEGGPFELDEPLSEIGEAYEVDPIRDLVPHCATCHDVVDSRIPPYSADKVRRSIQDAAA